MEQEDLMDCWAVFVLYDDEWMGCSAWNTDVRNDHDGLSYERRRINTVS
jgi:hypothetical protein